MMCKTLAFISIGLLVVFLWFWGAHNCDQPRGSSIVVNPDVQRGIVASTKAEVQDPIRTKPAPSDRKSQDDLIVALGSSHSDLRAMYKAGISVDAKDHQKYVAHQIANMCISTITRRQFAEDPSASGEKIEQMNAARAAIAERCSPLEREGTDQLTRSIAELGRQVESDGSRHSRSYANYAEARNNAERKAAADRLQSLFSEYGPIALQWESGDFSDYIRDSSSEFAGDLRLKAGNRQVVDYAVILTICSSGDLCGSDGLFYLWLCSEHGNCGGSVQAGLSDGLSFDEMSTAKSISERMLDGIKSGSWAR